MKKFVLLTPLLALVGCSSAAPAQPKGGWGYEEASWGAAEVHFKCIGPDKVFLMRGGHGGGIAVVAGHTECVK